MTEAAEELAAKAARLDAVRLDLIETQRRQHALLQKDTDLYNEIIYEVPRVIHESRAQTEYQDTAEAVAKRKECVKSYQDKVQSKGTVFQFERKVPPTI